MSEFRQQQCQKMLAAVDGAGEFGVTRKEFADLLKIKKSGHLKGLIRELLDRRLAIEVLVKDARNRPTFIYLKPLPDSDDDFLQAGEPDEVQTS